jgi:hypothetical protein
MCKEAVEVCSEITPSKFTGATEEDHEMPQPYCRGYQDIVGCFKACSLCGDERNAVLLTRIVNPYFLIDLFM